MMTTKRGFRPQGDRERWNDDCGRKPSYCDGLLYNVGTSISFQSDTFTRKLALNGILWEGRP